LQRDIWRKDYVLAGVVLDALVPCLKISDQCCVRFAAALGREVVERTLARFPHDKPVTKAAPIVLKHCLVRSSKVAKEELCRMRQSLSFCGTCRSHFYEYSLYVNSTLEHAIAQTVEGGFGAGPGGPYGSYLRGTVAERSLSPSGDTRFWFGDAVAERFRNGGSEEEVKKRGSGGDLSHALAAAAAVAAGEQPVALSSEGVSEIYYAKHHEDEEQAKLRRTSEADLRQVNKCRE
jgi:hypothetical protein